MRPQDTTPKATNRSSSTPLQPVERTEPGAATRARPRSEGSAPEPDGAPIGPRVAEAPQLQSPSPRAPANSRADDQEGVDLAAGIPLPRSRTPSPALPSPRLSSSTGRAPQIIEEERGHAVAELEHAERRYYSATQLGIKLVRKLIVGERAEVDREPKAAGEARGILNEAKDLIRTEQPSASFTRKSLTEELKKTVSRREEQEKHDGTFIPSEVGKGSRLLRVTRTDLDSALGRLGVRSELRQTITAVEPEVNASQQQEPGRSPARPSVGVSAAIKGALSAASR